MEPCKTPVQECFNAYVTHQHQQFYLLLGNSPHLRWLQLVDPIFPCLVFVGVSMGWLKGKSTGNHRFSHDIWDFPVFFPLNTSIECSMCLFKYEMKSCSIHSHWIYYDNVWYVALYDWPLAYPSYIYICISYILLYCNMQAW